MLLKKTGHSGPYILVGHSVAGVTLRSFVDKYPDEVAGVVFVDASHSLHSKRFATDPVLKILPTDRPPAADWIIRLEGNSGFARFMYCRNEHENIYSSTMYTDRVNVINKAFMPVSAPAFFEEVRAFDSICDKAEYFKDFGSIPLIVITAADKKKMEAEMGFANAKMSDAAITIKLELQKDLLKLSTNSKQIIARKSGHCVQLDEPQVVIDAVKELITDTRHQ